MADWEIVKGERIHHVIAEEKKYNIFFYFISQADMWFSLFWELNIQTGLGIFFSIT
jgi:hypothetical protein